MANMRDLIKIAEAFGNTGTTIMPGREMNPATPTDIAPKDENEELK